MNERFQLTVVRRVRLREDLKLVKAYWNSDRPTPDWLVITRVTDQKGYESFDLQFLKLLPAPCGSSACDPSTVSAVCTSDRSYETLRIAKAQAHADIGVEYVEWEPCDIEITDEDGGIDWGRALPMAEPAGST